MSIDAEVQMSCEQAPPPPADAGVEDMYDYQEWLILEACRISEERTR